MTAIHAQLNESGIKALPAALKTAPQAPDAANFRPNLSTTGAFANCCNAQAAKHLIAWRNQAKLPSNGTPLSECRFYCLISIKSIDEEKEDILWP
jgi:hypothetical protein